MKTRVIIPCAGFGTRMGMPSDQSKELLIDPVTNAPVIDYALDLCKQFNFEPVIMTREKKKDLIKYCSGKAIVHVMDEDFFGSHTEWPDTVLKSMQYWTYNNILLLPDTRFQPTKVMQDIDNSMKLGASLVFGVHKIEDPTKWCMVEFQSVVEKPLASSSKFAMGLVGFNKYSGYRLFRTLRTRNQRYRNESSSYQYLDSFVDITRTGKVEAYK